MKTQHPGFAATILLGVILIVGLLGFAGWRIITQDETNATTKTTDTTTKTTDQSEETPKNNEQANKISVKLLDSNTNQPLVSQTFELVSNNGIQCITAPCPTNEKRYTVRSNENGYITVDRAILQEQNFVTNSNYTSEVLIVSTESDSYELKMLPL